MTSNSSANGSNIDKGNNWSARQWLPFFGAILIAWTAIYLISHSPVMGKQGYQYTGFSIADIRNVNSILVHTTTDIPVAGNSRQRVTNSNDGFLDSYPVDSDDHESYMSGYPEAGNLTNITEAEDRKERTRKVMVYISSQFGTDIDPAELTNIEQYISNFTPRETGIFLNDYKLKVKSFFWLTGIMLYAEVVFWVIFGVLCSILFVIGNSIRKNNGKTQRDVLYQAARIFYAPFAAVILVLIYSYFKGGTTLHTEASEGIIVFAFILGFYSGIIMELLDALKDNLLHINVKQPRNEAVGNAHVYTQPYTAPQPFQQPPPPEQPPVEYTENTETVPQSHYDAVKHYPTVQQVKETRRNLNEDNEITEVDIDLRLDFSGLFDEDRLQLQRLGFSRAIVTLHNVNGKDIIPAKKLGDDMTTFVANDVKPGIYIARATLSQRLKDDQIINLFGEKTAYITEDKPGLELFVKKYEATD